MFHLIEKMFKFLIFLFSYLRISILFGILGAYLGPGILNIKNLISGKFSIKQYCLGGLLTALFSITVSLVNDFGDFESDSKNPRKKNKPVVSGKVPKELNLILTAVIIFVQIILVIYSKNVALYIFFIISIIGTFGYYEFKYIPPFDLCFNAVCSIFPFYFGWIMSTNKILPVRTIVMIILFTTIVFLHGDIWDSSYDENSTVKIIGNNHATNLIYFIIVLLFFILPANIGFLKYFLIILQCSFLIAYKFQIWNFYKIILGVISLIAFSGFLLDLNKNEVKKIWF